MSNVKGYSELIHIKSFKDRFRYLKLNGSPGQDDPEVQRWLHQYFYHTPEWREVRNKVLMRDEGKDLGISDRPIFGRLIVHHINPITKEDIINRSPKLFDLDNLITVSHITHNAIHYGNEDTIVSDSVERKPGDTTLW